MLGLVGVDLAGSVPLIMVRRAAQRRGIGTALMDAALERLRGAGVDRAGLASGGDGLHLAGRAERPCRAPRHSSNTPGGASRTNPPTTWCAHYAATSPRRARRLRAPGVRTELLPQTHRGEVFGFVDEHFPNWSEHYREPARTGARRPFGGARHRRGVAARRPASGSVFVPMLGGDMGTIGCVGRSRGASRAACRHGHGRRREREPSRPRRGQLPHRLDGGRRLLRRPRLPGVALVPDEPPTAANPGERDTAADASAAGYPRRPVRSWAARPGGGADRSAGIESGSIRAGAARSSRARDEVGVDLDRPLDQRQRDRPELVVLHHGADPPDRAVAGEHLLARPRQLLVAGVEVQQHAACAAGGRGWPPWPPSPGRGSSPSPGAPRTRSSRPRAGWSARRCPGRAGGASPRRAAPRTRASRPAARRRRPAGPARRRARRAAPAGRPRPSPATASGGRSRPPAAASPADAYGPSGTGSPAAAAPTRSPARPR